jgi:segregation and condensation protein B
MSIEVKRNHGKPTAAERARAKLDAQKAAEKAAKTGVAVPAAKSKPAKVAKATSAAPTKPPIAPMAPTSETKLASTTAPKAGSAESATSAAALAPKPAKVAKAASEAKPEPKSMEPVAPHAIAPKAVPDKPRNVQIRFTGMKPNHVVEAALFAAGKPILVEEICEASGLRPEVVKDALKEIQKEYAARDTVLEVSKAGTKWAMQVRSKASEPAAKFAPMEIPLKTLKTLALIAYHQPMKQSELVDMLGSKVYDHVPELIERGLIRAREEGVTKILTVTVLFPEYFGIDAESPEQIRMALASLVGMDPEKARAKAQEAAKKAMEAAAHAADHSEEHEEAAPPTDGRASEAQAGPEAAHEAELKH